MNHLIILNDPPYGIERSYDGLRLANKLVKDEKNTVRVFLIGDAASCGVVGQTTPNGYYNIERMLRLLASKHSRIRVCGSCMDARGIKPEAIMEGTNRSTMSELSIWTQEADKVIVF